MMNKKEGIENKLISFIRNPYSGDGDRYSDDKFWDKVKKYAKQAGKQTILYITACFFLHSEKPISAKIFEDDCSGGAQLFHFSVDLIPDLSRLSVLRMTQVSLPLQFLKLFSISMMTLKIRRRCN